MKEMVREANKKERMKTKQFSNNDKRYIQKSSILDNPLTNVFRNTLQTRTLEQHKTKNTNILKANLKAFK